VGVLASLAGRRYGLAGTSLPALRLVHRRLCATALGATLLVGACLPRSDLSDYSSSTAGQPGSIENPPGGDGEAGSGALEGAAGAGEMGPDTLLPLDMNGSEPSALNASTGAEDAGAELLDAGLQQADAGAIDAGPLENECRLAQGTLEPDSSVCLIFVSMARVNWQAAQLGCQTRGAALVSVKTVARNDFLTSLIGTTTIWLGANDPGTNPAANAFIWRDLSAVDLALPVWAAGEPDVVADQFCVAKTGEAAVPPGPAAPWRDRPCSDLNAYVCELSL
jgi:hypothetical protein